MDAEHRIAWTEEEAPLVIVGATATGKTAAAVEVAERIGGEIINADSMQVYRGMDIGTAKPDAETQRRVPFRLLDILTPEEPCTVSFWKERAEQAIREINRRGKVAILCGGTGLYIKALLDDWSLAQTPAQPEIRAALQQELEERGSPALHRALQAIDPESATRLHPNDGVRIVRALEVFRATGKTLSEFQAEDRAGRASRPAFRVGLTLPRPLLYERINGRVEEMIANGLAEEARQLLERGYTANLAPLRSLGYKEIIAYLNGKLDYTDAIEQIKQETRRYAKRQETWFRADAQITWLDVTEHTSAEVADRILEVAPKRFRSRPRPERH